MRHRHTSLQAFAALASLTVATLSGALENGAQPAKPFDYFSNSWSVIGLKDYVNGTRITADNQLLLQGDRHVVLHYGTSLTALSRKQTKCCMEGWLPVILLSAQDGPVRYYFTLWATPLPTVKDWQQAFDWPTEGENYLNWITIKATNTGETPAEAKISIKQTGKDAPAAELMARTIQAGKSAEFTARIPFTPVAEATAFGKEDPTLWLNRTTNYWKTRLATAAHIEVPCQKANETLLAAHVCQMIANDHGEVRGGEGFYDQFYIRDGAYQVMELEEAGMWDAARKSIELFLPRQNRDGRFESQAGQLDANGQANWAFWQYYKISGDRAFLERVYPAMRRAADWTVKTRKQTPDGILPIALADGEFLWNGKRHIVGYDFWNLRGLLCAADAARILGKTDAADELTKEAALYQQAIEDAWKKTELAYFPPSWEKAGTHWGNTETLWPTPLFATDDKRVAALIRSVHEEFAGGFVEGTIRWVGGGNEPVIHPYMGAYTTMADLIRGNDTQVVEDFYWYLLHSTAAHAFPEGIHYKRRFAWSDTIPHVTGACNYAIMLRHMLVHEQGDELHLLKAVPDWWLEDGREIRVEKLPTNFGEMAMTIRGTGKGVEGKFTKPTRQAPAKIVLHLPENRPLVSPVEGVTVVTRNSQKVRWDFPMVIDRYRKLPDGKVQAWEK